MIGHMICKRQITIEMSSMSSEVVIIGAGIGGLVSAALLAARGHSVTVIEKELKKLDTKNRIYHLIYRLKL